MPQSQPSSPTHPSIPRLLLFGHAGSGKSSLLGALLQAAQTQGDVLGAEVVDTDHRLTPIRNHLYAGAPVGPTRAELVSGPIQLCPLPGHPTAEAIPTAVELIDCDGSDATALLHNPDPIAGYRPDETLASAVTQSDLLLLVVNAAANDAELRATFEDFLAFLERVQGGKEFRREVGGFPVFVVLTQCDRLAQRTDNIAMWERRVRESLNRVKKRFNEFLEEHSAALDDDTPYLPFGSVNVQEYAVAIRRPILIGAPNKTDKPYGVAELFRDAFAAANDHRTRARASDRRLATTAWGALLALAMLVVGAVGVTVLQPPSADPELADRVRAYELREAPAGARLAEKHLARTKRVLMQFRADPGFSAMPEGLRTFVDGRLREIDDYQAYRDRLAALPAPAEARSREELDRTLRALTTEVALPAEYTWADTEAARLRDKWLADVPLIRAAEDRWYEWYLGLLSQATALTLTRSFEGDWRGRVGELDAAAEHAPWNPADPIPGSLAEPQPRGEPVPLRVPLEFDRVYMAHRNWDIARARLLHLRDLADALGLTPETGTVGPRPLVIPPPGPGADPTTLAGERLADLRRLYPRPSALYPRLEGEAPGPDIGVIGPVTFPEWGLANFPESGRSLLAARAKESAANGLRHARGLILAQLGATETVEGWARVAVALDTPPLRNWGRLLHVLTRLDNPRATDPVEELSRFLRKKEFDIALTGLELVIPLALRGPKVVPAGPSTITLTPHGGGPPLTRAFRPFGEGEPRGVGTAYRFGRDTGFVYRPGDGLRIEAPVRAGDQRFTLVWDDGPTRMYQFDRLGREPRLVEDGGGSAPAPGVTLTPAVGSNVPRIPLLMQDLRR